MGKNFYSLGLMSGTSIDGIDASIIKSNGEDFIEIIDDLYLKYNNSLKLKIIKTIDKCTSKEDLKILQKNIKDIEKDITIHHSKACKLIIKKNKKIKLDLIGFHGQTILHKPNEGFSIQIGDPKLLSKLTKTKVVYNFRENDILNGGQGAPLTPLYHRLILNKIKSILPSALINIGGISNITYQDKEGRLLGFDTGPGNCLIDTWIKNNTKMEFDKDGDIAKAGKSNNKILNKFLNDPYYIKKIPKTLDVKYFNIDSLKKTNLEDGCATLSMLTVKSICKAINYFKNPPKKILFSGGGRKNKYIINNIKKIIKKPIHLVDDFNFNGDFVESQAFGYLAIRSYLKKIITLPETTGVKLPSSGGSIYKI